MASIPQLAGRWRLAESRGFQESMEELGVGMTLRKMGAVAKPDSVISSRQPGREGGRDNSRWQENSDRLPLVNGALVQHREWAGKERTITRRLEGGELVVECVRNNVNCTRVSEKVE